MSAVKFALTSGHEKDLDEKSVVEENASTKSTSISSF